MTNIATAETTIAIAATLGVPVPEAITTRAPADAWAALQGIARGRADEWDRLGRARGDDLGDAAATIAQGYDRLASFAAEQQQALAAAMPAEDMDYRLSSL